MKLFLEAMTDDLSRSYAMYVSSRMSRKATEGGFNFEKGLYELDGNDSRTLVVPDSYSLTFEDRPSESRVVVKVDRNDGNFGLVGNLLRERDYLSSVPVKHRKLVNSVDVSQGSGLAVNVSLNKKGMRARSKSGRIGNIVFQSAVRPILRAIYDARSF